MGVAAKALLLTAAVLAAAWLTTVLKRVVLTDKPGTARKVPDCLPSLPNRDRWMYPAGPATALAGIFLGSIVIPFGPDWIAQDLGIGVFYFIVVLDFLVLAVALSGWGANTPHAVEAFYRVVAQLVAYVVPLGLAIVGAIMMAKSLSTTHIVAAQEELWFIVLQPLGFVLYIAAGLMQCYLSPFMEPFSETIGGGVLGASGGAVGLLWRLALAGLLFLVAAMGAVLFLGGWTGPWLPAPLWMALKTGALMALMLFLGSKLPPLSVARMLALSWKILIPLGLINVLVVGSLILLKIGPA